MTNSTQALVKRLKADHNDAEAQRQLYELLLPQTDAKNLRRSPVYRLIADNPKILGLHSVAIRLCRAVGDHALRLAHFEKLYEAGARGDAFCVEYGAMLRDNGQYERCLALCEEWIRAFPQSLDLLRLRANMHLVLNRHDEAIADWTRVSQLAVGDPQARAAIGVIKLLTSDCKDGFAEFSAARDRMLAINQMPVTIPEWRDQPITGKKLLLWGNEGVGDIVMFAGFLPWLAPQDAQITLAVYEKLVPLLARSFPEARVIPFMKDTLIKTADYDFQLAISELPARGLAQYIPAQHAPYLKADAARAAALREQYLAGGTKKLIGISWHTANKDVFHMRNIALPKWQPIFTLPNVQCVSLQYGDHADEIAEIHQKFPNTILTDPSVDAFADLDALSAQIAAMDEIVSIDNSTVHISGALGVKTTLLLSAASEWRWGLTRTDCLWYENLSIERQQKLSDWQPPITRVRERLAL